MRWLRRAAGWPPRKLSERRRVALGMALLLLGFALGQAQARSSREPPAQHVGVSAALLGEVPADSLAAQTGLEGWTMRLRRIALAPGGAIAEHSHAERPGLVVTVAGSWTEVRGDTAVPYPAGDGRALVEDRDTVHWFYNDGDQPTEALVCDLARAE